MTPNNDKTKSRDAALQLPSSVLFAPAFVRLLVVQFAYGMAYSTQFVLPKYLIEVRDASAAMVGGAQGVFNVAALLSMPLVGAWLDRVGRTRVLVTGHAIGFLGMLPFGFADDDVAILMLRAVHGVSFSMAFTAAAALAVDLAPPQRRAEAVGYAGTAMLATNAFGPLLAEVVATRFGWAMVFVACAAYCGVAGLVARGIDGAPLVVAPSGASRVRASAPLVGAVSASLAMGIGVGVSATFAPAAMVLEGVGWVAPYFIGFTAGAVLIRVGFGKFPDRLGHLRAATYALALYAFGLAVVSILPARFMFVGSFVIGIAHGVAYPAVAALTMGLVPPYQRGRAMSWIAGCYNLGVALSSAGLAPLEPIIGYRGLVCVGAAVMGAFAIALPRSVGRSEATAGVSGNTAPGVAAVPQRGQASDVP